MEVLTAVDWVTAIAAGVQAFAALAIVGLTIAYVRATNKSSAGGFAAGLVIHGYDDDRRDAPWFVVGLGFSAGYMAEEVLQCATRGAK